MKKIFFILIFTLIIFTPQLCYSFSDARSVCENTPITPQLNFYTSYGKLEYNTEYTKNNLTQLGKNIGMIESGDLASGLALIDVNSEYEISTSSYQLSNGGACIIPNEFSVYVGFQNPVIYLAKDLEPNSCRYNLVLRHEQVHQQINVNALEYFIPIIYDRVKMLNAQIKPLYVPSEQHIKAGINDLTNQYAEQINILVDEFKQEILLEQRKLDNRQHYDFESDICKHYNSQH